MGTQKEGLIVFKRKREMTLEKQCLDSVIVQHFKMITFVVLSYIYNAINIYSNDIYCGKVFNL